MRQKMEYSKMAGGVTPCHLLIPLCLHGRSSGCERHINFEKCWLGRLQPDKVLTGTSVYTHSVLHLCQPSLRNINENMLSIVIIHPSTVNENNHTEKLIILISGSEVMIAQFH